MKFDRVIVLCDGNQIYNDKPDMVRQFFNKLGLNFGKYTNPADQLLKLANKPESFSEDLNQEALLKKVYRVIDCIEINPDSFDKDERPETVTSIVSQ